MSRSVAGMRIFYASAGGMKFLTNVVDWSGFGAVSRGRYAGCARGEPAHSFSLILFDIHALSIASPQGILSHRIALRGVLVEVFHRFNRRLFLLLRLSGGGGADPAWTTQQPGQESAHDEEHEDGCD